MPACLEQEVTAEEIGETCQEKKVDRLQSGIPYVNLRCDCTSKTSPLTSDIIASRCLRRFRVGRPGTRLKGNGAAVINKRQVRDSTIFEKYAHTKRTNIRDIKKKVKN